MKPYYFASLYYFAVALLLSSGAEVSAQAPPIEPPIEAPLGEFTQQEWARIAELEALEASLSPQSGRVSLGDGLATIDVGEDLRFLGPADANRVIQAWQNPPMPNTLGMLIPTDRSLFSEANWAVVLTFVEDGWVDDEDAEDLDYDEILEEIQDGAEAENETRAEMGLPSMRVVGWAEPPSYDASTHRLYWARELETNYDGLILSNLNYSTRVLGRRGVLELNAVAGMDMLPEIRGQMQDVLSRVHFESGHRYEDFNPDMDEVAAYGIGALILGKFAGKAGVFAMIGVFLLKAKKLLFLAFFGVAAFVRRLRGGSAPETPDEELDSEAPQEDEVV